MNHILRAAALKANAIQMGSPDNPLIFVGVSAGTPNLVIERGVMDNLVSSDRFKFACFTSTLNNFSFSDADFLKS